MSIYKTHMVHHNKNNVNNKTMETATVETFRRRLWAADQQLHKKNDAGTLMRILRNSSE